MPRLLYKIIVGSAFAVEVLICIWLVDRHPGVIAWAGFAVLGLIDIVVFEPFLGVASEYVKRA